MTVIEQDETLPSSLLGLCSLIEGRINLALGAAVPGARVRCTPAGDAIRIQADFSPALLGNALDALLTPAALTPSALGMLGLTAGQTTVNVGHYRLGLGRTAAAQSNAAAGDDGTTYPETADLIGSPAAFTGIYALDRVDMFNMLPIPDATRPDPAEPARGLLLLKHADALERHLGQHHRRGGSVRPAAGGKAGAAGVEMDLGQRLLGGRERPAAGRRGGGERGVEVGRVGADGLDGCGVRAGAGLQRRKLQVEGEALAQGAKISARKLAQLGVAFGEGGVQAVERGVALRQGGVEAVERPRRARPSVACSSANSASRVSSSAVRWVISASSPGGGSGAGTTSVAATGAGGATVWAATGAPVSPSGRTSPLCVASTTATAAADAPATIPKSRRMTALCGSPAHYWLTSL